MDESFAKMWFQGFAEGINQLDGKERDLLFSCCAKRCADSFPVERYRRAHAQAGEDLTAFFRALDDGQNIRTSEVVRDRVYRIQYPSCGCDLYTNGWVRDAVLCACSRQSLLYCLHAVMPERRFSVEAEETVLGGGDRCSFQVTVL